MLIFNVLRAKLKVRIKVVTEVIMLHSLKNMNHTFVAVYFVLMINLASQLFFKEEKMQFINSLKQFFNNNMIIAKK